MLLEINEKDYSFIFGFGFIRELNKRYTEKENGLAFKMGLDTVLVNLLSGETETLVEVLKVANNTESPKISENDIAGYIEENGVETVFEMVVEELKKSEFTKKKTYDLIETMKKQAKK